MMNKTTKTLLSTAAIAAVVSTTPMAVSQVEAADLQFTEVAFDVNGETNTISFNTFASAMLNGEGNLYDFVLQNPISYIGLDDGSYITFDSFATAVLADDGRSVAEISADLVEDSSATASESEIDAFVTISGIDDDGNPIVDGEEGIVPEVISID